MSLQRECVMEFGRKFSFNTVKASRSAPGAATPAQAEHARHLMMGSHARIAASCATFICLRSCNDWEIPGLKSQLRCSAACECITNGDVSL